MRHLNGLHHIEEKCRGGTKAGKYENREQDELYRTILIKMSQLGDEARVHND